MSKDTPRTQAVVNEIGKSGVDWHHSATLMKKHAEALERENARLAAERDHLLKCCDFTTDGKPVVKGSTLYLLPDRNPAREPMKFETGVAVNYCWYASLEDNLAAIQNAK